MIVLWLTSHYKRISYRQTRYPSHGRAVSQLDSDSYRGRKGRHYGAGVRLNVQGRAERNIRHRQSQQQQKQKNKQWRNKKRKLKEITFGGNTRKNLIASKQSHSASQSVCLPIYHPHVRTYAPVPIWSVWRQWSSTNKQKARKSILSWSR